MRLIYVYFDSYRILRQEGFCFDSNFKCDYGEEDKTLKVQWVGRLPKCFFSPDDSVFVSGIVGENGSGKTSFACALENLAGMDDDKLKCILFFEDEKGYHVCGRGMTAHVKVDASACQDEKEKKKLLLIDDKASIEFPLGGFGQWTDEAVSIAYYSPIYTTQYPFRKEKPSFRDISTTYLLKHPEGDDGCSTEYGVARDALFDAEETRRILEFLQAKREKMDEVLIRDSQSISLPGPLGVLVQGDENQRQMLYHDFLAREKALLDLENKGFSLEVDGETLHVGGGGAIARDDGTLVLDGGTAAGETPGNGKIETTQDFYRSVKNLMEKANAQGLFVRAFVCYVFGLCAAEGIWDCDSPLDCFAGQLMQKCEECFGRESAVAHYPQKLIAFLRSGNDSRYKAAADAFDELLKLQTSGEAVADATRCNFIEKDRFAKLLKLVQLHALAKSALKTDETRDFIRFEVDPKASSGEWAFLSMLSRLYALIGKTQGSLLLFMDEAETTLHPKLQRNLVKNILWFLSNFAPGRSVHVIFASHSPVLLSDIPVSNVTFLRRPDDEVGATPRSETVSVLKPRLGFTDTFGANIFDLYNLSFFMDEGTVGAFASDKMRRILGEENVEEKERLQIANMVGDPFLRGYYEDELQELEILKK